MSHCDDQVSAQALLYQAIVDSLLSTVAVLDRQGNIVAVNRTWQRFCQEEGGSLAAAAPGVNYLDACRAAGSNELTAAKALEGLSRLLAGELTHFELEYPCPSADQNRWFLLRASPLSHPGGGIVIAHLDITRRVLAEQRLRESENRYRLLAENSTDFIVVYSPQGRCTYASPACRRLLGYASEELVGTEWLFLVHPDDQPRALAAYQEAWQSLLLPTLTGRFRRKDGSYVEVEVTGRIVRADADGSLLEFQFNVRDVTERQQAARRTAWLLEQAINAQEEERRRIARELHDETGQSLTSLLVGLRTLEDLPTLEAVRAQAGELRQIIIQTIQDVRRLAAGLRPSLLDDLGLAAALHRYVADYGRDHGLSVHLDADDLRDQRLSPGIETTVYRIIQEALTNIARHAQAKNVRIDLDLGGDSLTVLVEDDGRGFDVQAALGDPALGKHLGLASMRERATLLGGFLIVDSRIGYGATLRLEVPLGESLRRRHGNAAPALR